MRQAKLGKALSPEHRANLSKALIGRSLISEEKKEMIRKFITGNTYSFAFSIEVLDLNTSVTTIYRGFRQVEAAINVASKTIVKYDGKQYKNYIFKIIKNNT